MLEAEHWYIPPCSDGLVWNIVRTFPLISTFPGTGSRGRLFLSHVYTGGGIAVAWQRQIRSDPMSMNWFCSGITKYGAAVNKISYRNEIKIGYISETTPL